MWIIPASLNKRELRWGLVYLCFQLLLLPTLIIQGASFLPVELGAAQLNFIMFAINFVAVMLIFRRFLLENLDTAISHPAALFKTVLFGFVRYMVMNMLVGSVILQLDPNFANANDASISAMVESDLFLMALGTIVLVPPVEECLFRGLLFRSLLDKHKPLAYGLSTVCFAAIHLVGYLGVYTPMELFLGFLQYLPAGICLAWSYARSGTIFTPILIHSMVNTVGIVLMRQL